MSLKQGKLFYFLVALITFLKIVFAIFLVPDVVVWEDGVMAENLFKTGELFYESDGVKNYAYQFPVYPFVIYCLYKLFGACYLPVIILHVFIYSLTAILFKSVFCYWDKQGNWKTGKLSVIDIGSVLFLLHPFLNYYTFKNIHPLIFNVFTFVLALFWVEYCFLNKTIPALLVLTFVLALLLLDRSTLFVAMFVYILYKKTKEPEKGSYVKLILFTCIIPVILITPWLVRNYKHTGSMQLVLTSGKLLWKGNHPALDGANYDISGNNYYTLLSEQEVTALGKLDAVTQDEWFKDNFFENLKNNKWLTVKLYVIKVFKFFFWSKSTGKEYGAGMMLVGYKIIQAIVLLLCLLFYVYNPNYRFFLLLPLLLALLQSVFYVEIRHRMPVEAILLFCAFIAAVQLYKRYSMPPES